MEKKIEEENKEEQEKEYLEEKNIVKGKSILCDVVALAPLAEELESRDYRGSESGRECWGGSIKHGNVLCTLTYVTVAEDKVEKELEQMIECVLDLSSKVEKVHAVYKWVWIGCVHV